MHQSIEHICLQFDVSSLEHKQICKQNTLQKISASGCGNFEKVGKDLKTLQNLIDTYLRLMPLLCNYSFDECTKDFGHDKASNTKAVCAEISKLHLNNILKIAPLLDISCLPIPDLKTHNIWAAKKEKNGFVLKQLRILYIDTMIMLHTLLYPGAVIAIGLKFKDIFLI